MYTIGLEKPLSCKLCPASTPEPISVVIMSEFKISQCNVLVRIANPYSEIKPPVGALSPSFQKQTLTEFGKPSGFYKKPGGGGFKRTCRVSF